MICSRYNNGDFLGVALIELERNIKRIADKSKPYNRVVQGDYAEETYRRYNVSNKSDEGAGTCRSTHGTVLQEPRKRRLPDNKRLSRRKGDCERGSDGWEGVLPL